MSKLIYVMDPLCGWCYGNSTNTQKLYEKYKNLIDFEILPAGMWIGTNARKQSKQMAQFIKKHDPQVQQTTGTEFGKAYFEFIENENIILDSEVPSRAIVSVKKLWVSQSIPFAIEVQKARYWYGKDLNSDETYLSICDTLGLDKVDFLKTFHSETIKKETQETFVLAQQYASSYPTLLAEKERKIYILEQGYASFETITKQIDLLYLLN
ncbi:DsbA family protein [Flavobacterium sp. CF136]|uniref:DsbA family protein n=1 Tax=Flavobacterium sp. (strain CF136) TaxID=1144313 RepID=UPI0002DD98FE|nr:DsbA family protein [Flavobacterium sp. CF136]